jgi:hypothetical protein
MTTLVSEAGIFGMNESDLMPVVFIEKVTLKGGSDPYTIDDPHIDHEWEGTYVKDAYGNLKFEHLGHSLSRKPKTSTALVSTVDLIVKDYVSNEKLSLWFHDNEILKYMNIRVIQSRDSRLTAELNAGKMSSLKKGRYRNRYEQKVISLGVTDKELENYYVQDETGRGELSSIPYSVTFVSKDLEPDHLSYFVFCFLNIKKLSQDYNLHLYGYDYDAGIISKRVTQETVLDNNQLVSESHVYYTPDGQIWAGPVHFHPSNGWMAGAVHTSKPHQVLTRETFINATVQDFRNIQQIEGASISLKPVDTMFDELREKYSANEIREIKSVSYFSDAFMSRANTSGGTSHFVFSFNYLDFLKNQSQLGMLYQSGTSTRNQILRQSKIKSIKVFRHRVSANGLFNTAGVKTSGDAFKENPYDTSVGAPTLIAQSSDRAVLSLRPDRKTSRDEKLLGSIREVNLANHDIYLRSFAVTDYAADNLTDGTYKYSVEITVEDGASSFIKNQIKRIKKALQDMTLYGELASSHGYYDSVSGRFRKSLLKYYLQETTDYQKFPWVFSLATFVDIVGFLVESDAQDMPLFRQLMSMINPKTGTPEGIAAVIGLMGQLESLMESAVGTTDILQNRIQKAVGLSESKSVSFLKAEKMFTNIFDSEIPHKYGLDFLNSENRNGYAGPKTITFGDYGDRLVQENIKYFSPSPTLYSDPIASPAIGQARPDMIERVPSDVIQAMSNFSTYGPSYLTPANFRNGKNILDNTIQITEGSDREYLRINNFCIKFLNSSFDQRSGMFSVSNRAGIANVEKIDFLAKLGVSVLTEEQYRKKIDEPERESSGVQASDEILGASSDDDFVSETLSFTGQTSSPPMTGVNETIGAFLSDPSLINSSRYSTENTKASLADQQEQSLTKEDLNYKNWTDTLQSYQSGFTEAGATWDTAAITSLPNQIKSAFWSGESSIRMDYQSLDYDYINNPKTANAFILNHQVVARVETLTAQKNIDGVLEYNWSPLTQDVFNASVGANMILARVVPYTESRLKVGTSRYSDIPYYDTHFLLAPTEQVATQNEVSPTVLARDTTMKTMLNLGKNLTQKMVKLVSASYLRSTSQPKIPRNSDDRGYYDVFRKSKGNVVVRLLEETGCDERSNEPPLRRTQVLEETPDPFAPIRILDGGASEEPKLEATEYGLESVSEETTSIAIDMASDMELGRTDIQSTRYGFEATSENQIRSALSLFDDSSVSDKQEEDLIASYLEATEESYQTSTEPAASAGDDFLYSSEEEDPVFLETTSEEDIQQAIESIGLIDFSNEEIEIDEGEVEQEVMQAAIEFSENITLEINDDEGEGSTDLPDFTDISNTATSSNEDPNVGSLSTNTSGGSSPPARYAGFRSY